MILVDTSVWIDFFKDNETPQVGYLERAIQDSQDLALCGIILTEILQGIRNNRQHRLVLTRLVPLIRLPMDEPIFILAADLYRQLRQQGITIRKTNDCIIAATAIKHEVRLLHNDRDFEWIRQHSILETVLFGTP